MRRSGLAAFAVLACVLGFASAAAAQAPQPAPQPLSPAPVQPPPAGTPTPGQPGPTPRVQGAPAAPGQEVRRPLSYRSCIRAAKRRGLRGSQRRLFLTRCRLGRENLNR